MADRIHSYPMFPPNLAPSSLQQSQIPQQPPQSQQPDPQMMSALSNSEQARLWQLQNAYRPQQSSDLAASQMNHQMQEFVRGQALSHTQGQSMVPQIQQPFGLNTQRMNPTVFHDPQTSQPQSLMPNFSSVPMNTQQQMKPQFNMNPMMHGLNNPGVSRQLKMLNQQEFARMQQQSGLGAQHTSSQPSVDMFVSPPVQPSQDQIHGSPHPSAQPVGPPGPNQGMVHGNPQQNAQKRMMTPTEFQERRKFLLESISRTENDVAPLLQTVRAGPIDPAMQRKISDLRTELEKRRDMYTKFMSTFGAMMMANAGHLDPMGHPTPQQLSQATVPNAQVQPAYATQPNQAVTAQYNISASNGSSLAISGQGVLNQQIPVQPPHPQMGRPIPPRSGGTPHQLPNTASPGLGNLAAQSGQKVSNQTRQSAVMPLNKQRFESTYAQFCRSQGMEPRSCVAIGENRMVDLHQLHVHVIRENGAQSVTQRDMWAVIGGQLGFTQFPGNDSEPARCGPGIAQQLQNTYDQWLQHFENAYVLTVRNHAAAAGPQQQQMNTNSPANDNSTSPGNHTGMPSNRLNQQLIAAAARYANTSVQDMRAQHVHEPMVTFVDRNRSELQKVYHQQLLMAKRNVGQDQQNMMNAQNQLPNMHDQSPISLPLQRPMGMNPMANMTPGDPKMVNGPFIRDNVAAALPKPQLAQEHVQQAMMATAQFKQGFQQRLLEMPPLSIPDDQRLEYEQLLEQMYKMTSDLNSKLHMYFMLLKNEEVLRKMVTIALTVARQRQLLSSTQPQYIINLNNLRNMQAQILKINEDFELRWRAMRASAMNGVANPSFVSISARHGSLAAPPVQNPSQTTPPAPQITGRTVSVNSHPHQPPQPSPTPAQLPHPSRPQSQSQHTTQPPHLTAQHKKPFHPSIPRSPSVQPVSATLASPTPPPTASSTPATGAPTPQTTVASPQTPKSPPSKTVSKAKPASRASRKLSTAGKGPATPETVPSIAGVKRPSEEEVATLTSVASSEAEASNAPSPKKVKTEWEGEVSEALVKRKQQVENVKTEEDATALFDQMKELFDRTASTDEEIHQDIASTLDQILAGMAQGPADAAALSAHVAGEVGPPTALSPHVGPANDAFLEYIDFSSFTTLEDEDNDSKAPTPDLVHSETNPSPESGSEGDLLGGAGSPEKHKIEESGDRTDALRLGPLKEIDGGESAYYQVGDWKWEGSMHTLDQPWAIFTS